MSKQEDIGKGWVTRDSKVHEQFAKIGVSFLKAEFKRKSLATVGIGAVTFSFLGGVGLGIWGINRLYNKYREKKKQEKIDQELKAVYKEAFEKATDELTDELKKSEAEREKLIALIKEMKKYQEEFLSKTTFTGEEMVAYNYAKGVTDGIEANYPALV